MKDLDYSALMCGIVYLSKRLGKELPDFHSWSSYECRVYLLGLEKQFKEQVVKCPICLHDGSGRHICRGGKG